MRLWVIWVKIPHLLWVWHEAQTSRHRPLHSAYSVICQRCQHTGYVVVMLWAIFPVPCGTYLLPPCSPAHTDVYLIPRRSVALWRRFSMHELLSEQQQQPVRQSEGGPSAAHPAVAPIKSLHNSRAVAISLPKIV